MIVLRTQENENTNLMAPFFTNLMFIPLLLYIQCMCNCVKKEYKINLDN